jgi:hypothetical protein
VIRASLGVPIGRRLQRKEIAEPEIRRKARQPRAATTLRKILLAAVQILSEIVTKFYDRHFLLSGQQELHLSAPASIF